MVWYNLFGKGSGTGRLCSGALPARRYVVKPDRLIDRLVERIVEVVYPLRIILFGSAARGDMRPDSDINVVVVMPEGTNRHQVAGTLYRQLMEIPVPLDILVTTPSVIDHFSDAPSLTYYEIVREGRDVYAA